MKRPTGGRTKAETLGSEAWEEAALTALATVGFSAVAVEPLARTLGVTKGSFYWHFADREALVRAMLARWEERYTERVIHSLSSLESPRERLVCLLTDVSLSETSWRVHVALGAAAGEPEVAATLARVARRRIAYLEECYSGLGLPKTEARRSAVLAYSSYLGLIHLQVEGARELPKGAEREAYAAHTVNVLIPPG